LFFFFFAPTTVFPCVNDCTGVVPITFEIPKVARLLSQQRNEKGRANLTTKIEAKGLSLALA